MALISQTLMLLGSVFVLFQPAIPLSDIAQQAAVEYEAGNYEAARTHYTSLIESGVQDGVVFTNLGHTYYQLQDLGAALVNYRRAQIVQPRDAQINSGLARIRSLRTDIQGDETALIDNIAAMTVPIATSLELTWAMSALWCLYFGFVIVMIIRKQSRDSWRGTFVLLSTILLFGLLLWGSRVYVDRFRPAAIIIEPTVQVMSGPGADYLPIYNLHAAAELRILEQRDAWVRFILPDQRQGWIQEEMIERV